MSIESVKMLIEKGVTIPNPGCVEIGKEVDISRISGENVTIHAGSKIFGSTTLILQGSILGYEAPVTLENCQLGPHVELKGGYFKEAVFLEKSKMGSGSHVREGTILEEEASCAHTVGLKQTILFPFVTLGSLINFCDCFMAGGTGKKDHSEVGSSYIHFNFTPNQDKATPSMVGDVTSGVMMNQNPIFLGGQGGLVGPCRLSYGTIIGAGTINRKDELRPNRLIVDGISKRINTTYTPGIYQNVKRIINNNIYYIANLYALLKWYEQIRVLFISKRFPGELHNALVEKVNMGISERLKKLRDFGNKVKNKNDERNRCWNDISGLFKLENKYGNTKIRDSFIETIQSKIKISGKDYIKVVKGLSKNESSMGSEWLQSIVDGITKNVQDLK